MAKFLFVQADVNEIIVENGKPFGGAVVETFVWMESLSKLGETIQLFKLKEETRRVKQEFNWVETIEIFDSYHGIKWFRWFYYRIPVMFSAIRKCQPDYLYESIPSWNSVFLGLICRITGTKHIIRIANDNMLDDRIKITHSKFEQVFIGLAFRICDVISVQNEFQYQALAKRYPNKKIIKLFNPIKVDRREIDASKIDGYFAWVANFRFQKNLDLLYRIAKSLPSIQIKIAGSPVHPIDQETADSLKLLKTLENVEFVGVVDRDHIWSFFSKAKYLLNTSRYEGFSNTFLEAMVTGTPILTTAHVNPDNIVSHYNLGYIYENESDLVEILKAESVSDYWQKSRNSQNYVDQHHDYLTLGKKLVDFLKSEN